MSGLILLTYLILMTLIVIGWRKSNSGSQIDSKEGVSILIPFRNESCNLSALLTSLQEQIYGGEIEIILVNDHSDDDFEEVINPFLKANSKLRLVHLEDGTGKKAALKQGVNLARFELILQTDADCEVGPHWVSKMSSALTTQIGMVLGPISVKETGKWSWFNQIETIMLQSITAAGIYWNQPLMSNGANLLYRKGDFIDYQATGLGSSHASGDDQFLTEYITQSGKSISYLKDKDALVKTVFPHQWDEMVEQRARWAGKNKRNAGLSSFISLFIAGVQVYFFFLLVGIFYDFQYLWMALNFFLIKSLLEGIVVAFSSSFFSFKAINRIPLFALYYPFFFIQIAFKAFMGKTSWKGREIS